MAETNIVIREGRRTDCKEIKRLIQELADFEKMPNGPKISAEALERDGFDTNPPLFGCFVAEDTKASTEGESILVGFCIYYDAYSTWNGKKLHLEDVYVASEFRKQHIGHRLFKAVTQKAVNDGYCYIEFSVLTWNPARAFYEARGCHDMTESENWHMYRLQGDDLLKFASS